MFFSFCPIDITIYYQTNQKAMADNKTSDVMVDDETNEEVFDRPPLFELPRAHPEEDQPFMNYDDEEGDQSWANFDSRVSSMNMNKKELAAFKLPNAPEGFSEATPTFAAMRALREVSKNTQGDTWNPIAEGAPPPWKMDGWVPAISKHIADKKVAEAESAAVDPTTLGSLIAGRNLAVTQQVEEKDLANADPTISFSHQLYHQVSAQEPFYYQQVMKKTLPSQKFGPVLLVDSDYGSTYTPL